jgi:hypothetical protein
MNLRELDDSAADPAGEALDLGVSPTEEPV